MGVVRDRIKKLWQYLKHASTTSKNRKNHEENRKTFEKISFGWSDSKVKKTANIILKQFTQATEQEEFWQGKLKMTATFKSTGDGLNIYNYISNINQN